MAGDWCNRNTLYTVFKGKLDFLLATPLNLRLTDHRAIYLPRYKSNFPFAPQWEIEPLCQEGGLQDNRHAFKHCKCFKHLKMFPTHLQAQ